MTIFRTMKIFQIWCENMQIHLNKAEHRTALHVSIPLWVSGNKQQKLFLCFWGCRMQHLSQDLPECCCIWSNLLFQSTIMWTSSPTVSGFCIKWTATSCLLVTLTTSIPLIYHININHIFYYISTLYGYSD